MEMADTINAEVSNALDESDTVVKSKKPSNSAFKQQRLAAWQPILTAGTVLPTFFVIGILFIPVGIGLWYFSDNVSEIIIPYTDCESVIDQRKCSEVIAEKTPEGGPVHCQCKLNFTLTEPFKGTVYMYYALTNFYQNHRRYVKSRDDAQLLGGIGEPSSECLPFQKDNNGKPYWPCGAIANSMFNDVITLSEIGKAPHNLIKKGIAWESDKQFKFNNPSGYNTTEFRNKYAQPRDWPIGAWDLDRDSNNNGLENEDFIVWMRTAALPNFRKLYRIINPTESGFRDGMPKGEYILNINYTYSVTSFQGTKSIVFSTTSLMGGKNPFLGISYVVMGCVCLVLGIIFLFVHINYGKSTWEMTNVDAVNEIFLELIRQELSDEGIFNLEGLENSDEPDDSDSDEGSDGDSNSEEELDYPDGLNDYGDDQYKDIEIEYD